MKLFNLFKKEDKVSNAKFEALNKSQLNNVVGGGDGIVAPVDPGMDPSVDPSGTVVVKSKSNIKNN